MAKNLTKLKFPYNFKGFTIDTTTPNFMIHKLRFLSLASSKRHLGSYFNESFSSIYTSVLSAMCDHDFDYLQTVMENRLFEATKKDILRLKDENFKLNYLEPSKNANSDDESSDPDEPKVISEKYALHNIPYQYIEDDMKINLLANGVMGVDIKRQPNKELYRLKREVRDYYFNFLAPLDLFKKQILVIYVFYYTKRKIYVSDQENFVIHGTEDIDKWLPHCWRFETYIDKMDWILTDMDNYLNGNPYKTN